MGVARVKICTHIKGGGGVATWMISNSLRSFPFSKLGLLLKEKMAPGWSEFLPLWDTNFPHM